VHSGLGAEIKLWSCRHMLRGSVRIGNFFGYKKYYFKSCKRNEIKSLEELNIKGGYPCAKIFKF
jgi:hypothetical protein